MITIYNYPYYPKHMEALGYEKEVDWVQVAIEIPKDIPSKYVRVSKQVKEMFGLHVKKLTNADVSKRGYGKKVFNLLIWPTHLSSVIRNCRTNRLIYISSGICH